MGHTTTRLWRDPYGISTLSGHEPRAPVRMTRATNRVVIGPIGEAGDISIGDLQMKGMKLAA
jgi:hypothetical protein